MTIVCTYGRAKGRGLILPMLWRDTLALFLAIMVWGLIGYDFRSPLVVIRGTLMA